MSVPRPARAIFREDNARATLAMDPGGSGVIAGIRKGSPPQPGAFGYFDCPPPVCFVPEEVCDGVAVLAVTGPLEHHQSWLWTSYEALVAQIERAVTHGDVRALILKIDSPGGVAAGMGEAHKAIRALSKKYGIPIYAYADEMACSAAYHLASACAEVWTSEAGVLGSVGVILCTIDETKALEKAGVAVRYVVTGARKADMHPGQPVTDDVLDVAQAKVDYLGALFFKAVAKARGLAPKAVEGLQAAVFHGPAAVAAGLADGVAGWDAFFQYVKDSVRATTVTPKGETLPAGTSRTGTARTAKAMMATRLQAQEALAKARAAYKAAAKALQASPDDPALLKAFASAAVAKATAKVDAKMSKVTKTSKHVTMEESDSEEESAPPSTAKSAASSSEMSSAESSEEEEEEEKAAASSGAKSSKGKPFGESEEEEEEEAVTKAWAGAHKAYKASTKGTDAYAIHGPRALLKAVLKATGQTTVAGAMGVLAAMPKRRAADAKIIARVETIEANGRREKVNALVATAKSEGRAGATSHDGRASLRALGMEQGTKFLKAHLATLPVVANTKERGPRADAEGNVIGAPGADAQGKMMEQAMAGLNPKERAEFVATLAEKTKSATPGGRI